MALIAGQPLRIALPSPGPISGPAARQAAKQELSKREYHRDDPGVFQRAVNWVLDRLAALLNGVSSPGGFALLIVLVLILALLGVALWRAGPLRRAVRGPASMTNDPLRPQTAIDHRALAQRFSDQGDFALAVREWLRAAVQTIEERGVLDPRPGRTGTEVAREAGARMPDAQPALLGATRAFEQIWFAPRPATVADVEVARQAADAVRRARIAEPAR